MSLPAPTIEYTDTCWEMEDGFQGKIRHYHGQFYIVGVYVGLNGWMYSEGWASYSLALDLLERVYTYYQSSVIGDYWDRNFSLDWF